MSWTAKTCFAVVPLPCEASINDRIADVRNIIPSDRKSKSPPEPSERLELSRVKAISPCSHHPTSITGVTYCVTCCIPPLSPSLSPPVLPFIGPAPVPCLLAVSWQQGTDDKRDGGNGRRRHQGEKEGAAVDFTPQLRFKAHKH